MTEIRIALVGKNTFVREGLRCALSDSGFDVVAVGATASSLRATVEDKLQIDIIVVNADSAAQGQGSCRELRGAFHRSKIVLLGNDFSIQATSEAVTAGCDGYLAKDIRCLPLARSLRLVAAGEKLVSTEAIDAIAAGWSGSVEKIAPNLKAAGLSDRELRVLHCLKRGDANKLISRELVIAEATVKIHVKSIIRKLGVLNRTQAAVWAMSRS